MISELKTVFRGWFNPGRRVFTTWTEAAERQEILELLGRATTEIKREGARKWTFQVQVS